MKKFKNFKKHDPFYKREVEKYGDAMPSREYISTCLESVGKPVAMQKILELFDFAKAEQSEALRRRIVAMSRDGQLVRDRRGRYGLVDHLELVRGRVLGHKDGFGFLVTENTRDDIFISPYEMRALFTGDIVLARVIETDYKKREEAHIVEILERNTQHVVGRFLKEGHSMFVVPDSKTINQDVLIPQGEAADAKIGQYVAAEIMTQPTARRQATGRIVEVLGDELSPGMEIEIAIRSHGLPHRWPEAVKDEAMDVGKEVREQDKNGRKDLRDLPLVTIDGEDAKDFDDAVYCEPKPKGGWRLVVAIADVSHYVKPGSALDEEAFERGNSVYFPGRVIPMLPFVLSNGLCSLNPNADRLCMVSDMTISAEGKLTQFHFYEAVMRSHGRLTYTEVANIIAGKTKAKMALHPQLNALHDLYKALSKQREYRGALEFETTETRIVFGQQGKIKKIVPSQRNVAHRIIEECMLAANVSAAKFLAKNGLPLLYRVHEGPKASKLENLHAFLNSMGLSLGGKDKPTPLDYSAVLRSIEDRPDANIIQTVLLRSLQQAVYTPSNGGHFGLAYESYTHFTSPIRRYPDLMVHRAIRHAVQHDKKQEFMYDEKAMAKLGQHCSVTERRADAATYDAVDWLKCYYMRDKLGQEYDGMITGVTSFGVFIELQKVYVEGLLHISALKGDYYHFDAIHHCLTGKHSGQQYKLGDAIRVMVARVDLDQRQIDFELVAAS